MICFNWIVVLGVSLLCYFVQRVGASHSEPKLVGVAGEFISIICGCTSCYLYLSNKYCGMNLGIFLTE